MFIKHCVQQGRVLQRKFTAAHVCGESERTGKTNVHFLPDIPFLAFLSTTRRLHTTSKMARKTVCVDNMNQNMRVMEYAVRGPLVVRANELRNELAQGAKKPFNEVIRANIGDCHAMGQKPITFIRQVITLCTFPHLMSTNLFPPDVKKKASDILKSCDGGSVGSYSDSTGISIVKQHITEYIQRRDCIPSSVENIILSSGASEGIKSILEMLNFPHNGKKPGIMVSVPQYPLYSATIAEYGMELINYYLDEDNDWKLSVAELKRSINEARKKCEPRAICVINPANPTGSVLTKENIIEIIKFAYEEKLFLMADEVYQDNIYAEGMQFHSFKKTMTEMGEPYKSMELASFMSVSKGYMGECGLRGGYCEVVNLDPEVRKILLKCISARLCSSTLGQIAMDCVTSPPQKGEPSYDLWLKEKTAVLQSLKERAIAVEKTFNSIPGIRCNRVSGAMYAFPQIKLPEKAIAKAKAMNVEPDFFYAMELLEHTGICVVPGSGFGQRPGTYHFRTTILPQPDKLKIMLQRLGDYHVKFLEQYK